MSRFFKSAAFPILIVVVLAFFAQKLISPGDGGTKYTYGDFVTQLNNSDVKTVTLESLSAVSWVGPRRIFGRALPGKPSPFLADIGETLRVLAARQAPKPRRAEQQSLFGS